MDHCLLRITIRAVLALLVTLLAPVASHGDGAQEPLALIPLPAHVQRGTGHFLLTPQTRILVTPETRKSGQLLRAVLSRSTGFPLPLVNDSNLQIPNNSIQLSLSTNTSQFGEEGYRLSVQPQGVQITAFTPAGIFYACQTLRQLFPPAIESSHTPPLQSLPLSWSAPEVLITDQPQFVWRGLMLDPARQFISKQRIFQCIEWMSFHKLNRLHLHLTDVDGWRIEIPKYPRLTRVGAYSNLGEGIRVGGFYSRKDIQEIVSFAADHFVMVIPEIETPSHSGAALAAYPELNCFGTRKSATLFSIDPLCGSEYCPGNDKVFDFLTDVFAEVARLFPSPYIHVGGDEAEMRYWGECPKCQARHKQVGNLHTWFMHRVQKIAASNGKRIIGWSGVAPGAVFTCWDNDGSGGWAAAKAGWDVIMSTGNHLYLNYNIDRTTLKTTYSFNPAPTNTHLSPEARNHILGIEACLWGEMVSEDHIESQSFPRILAVAERGWGIDHPDYLHFAIRVQSHVDRLANMGITTGPAFGYPITTTLPATLRDAMPKLILPPCTYENDEDWRWKLTGIDKGQGYDSLHPAHAFDGDLDTYHLTWGPRKEVDSFTVALKKPDSFHHVQAITGLPNGDHRLRQGILEISTGYGRWTEVARFKSGIADANIENIPIVAIRIRSTINQPPQALLAIREIVLTQKNGQSTLRPLTPAERLRLNSEPKP